MGTKFQIADQFIDIDNIKEYCVENVKYIYRPRYLREKSFANKISHKVYTFQNMEPYKPYEDGIILEDIPYAIINSNGSLDEEDGKAINKSTKEYHSAEVRNIQSLVIVADKKYVFYGSGVDCISAKLSYDRLHTLIKNAEKGTKKAEATNKVLITGQGFVQNGVSWYKGLNKNKKTIVISAVVMTFFAIIIAIGSATESDDYEVPTVSEKTNVSASDTTTKDYSTTEITTAEEITEETTTEETTEETTSEETTEELTTEIVTDAIVNIVEDETEIEYIEHTTEEKNSRTVYITPTGKKYHCSASCAGKNAMARDYDDVAGSYDPCKKCAY